MYPIDLWNYIASKLIRSRQILINIKLPDGDWILVVHDSPLAYWDEFDYTLPDTREQEAWLIKKYRNPA